MCRHRAAESPVNGRLVRGSWRLEGSETGKGERKMTPSSITVLVVDNEREHAEIVAYGLSRVGYVTEIATSGEEAIEKITNGYYDVIFTDLIMDRVDGFGVLNHARESLPNCAVIIMTGHGSVPSAVSAMQQGAFNYLLKPLDLKQLRAVAEKGAESASLKRTNLELLSRLDEKFGFEKLVGNSPEMRSIVEKLRRVSPTNSTVLIQGATGTGKELIAQAIHQNSPRKNKPFVGLNCAALSDNLLESELFGHVKGAFTGAISDRMGKIEYANGGTLFLDEVGDMPMATQIKLLRVLEESEITRVGSNEPIKVNVRLLSATNRDLTGAIEAGTFRSDLYHRLKVVAIRLPSLVERSGDIPVLVDYFVKFFSEKHQKPIRGITSAARKYLMQYEYPGNVRQLRNMVESMVVMDYDGLLNVDDLPEELDGIVPAEERRLAEAAAMEELRRFQESKALRKESSAGDPEAEMAFSGEKTSGGGESAGRSSSVICLPSGTGSSGGVSGDGLVSYVGKTMEELELEFLRVTLEHTNGNREEAANLLGISERTLYRKLKDGKLLSAK